MVEIITRYKKESNARTYLLEGLGTRFEGAFKEPEVDAGHPDGGMLGHVE